ncbi:hypothetical protein [Gordonia sp. (in: high G+C Gram-positive bacteria)]|uniref:hypothetical protein n=1 Tax=Gordonia sp. (in: high G+C Gram-positive bacteria) TaxID=84139 RepID=UPI0039E3AAC2
MSDQDVRVIAAWPTMLDDGAYVELAIIGDRAGEQIALALARQGDQAPTLLAHFYDEESAQRASALITHIIRMPEHGRVGGEDILGGTHGDHPGVEWVAPGELSDDPDPGQRISAGGLRRLWVVPSTDGEVLGLLAPGEEPRDLGEFVSAAAGNTFIRVIDTLIGDPRYSVFADE